jgi:hypothetical protein
MRFVTLDFIVRNICAVQLQDASFSQYPRVARAVRSAVIQAQMNFVPAMKSQLIEVDDNYIAQLPPDADTVTKVGLLTKSGRIVTLIRDNGLRRDQLERLEDEPEYCECEQAPDVALEVPLTSTPANVFHNVTWNAYRYGEMYSVPTLLDYVGTWRHNEQVGVLEMGAGTLVQTGIKILVEYKALGDVTMIPMEAQEAIEAFAMYKLDFNRAPGKAQFSMNEFRRHAAMLKRQYAAYDGISLLNAFMRGQKSTI